MAAHVHSEWSYDGSWTLHQIAASFARRRYDVVLMCEHSQTFTATKWAEYRQACAEASRPGLLLVPGIEYADADDVLHLPVWGDVGFYGDRPDPGLLLEAVRQDGAVSVLAHPWRKDAWSRVDPAWYPLLTGLEVWNRKYDGTAPRPEAVAMADRSGVQPFVSLDFHNRRQFFPLAMTADVPATGITAVEVYDLLRRSRCTPRLGPLDVTRLSAGIPGTLLRTGVRAG